MKKGDILVFISIALLSLGLFCVSLFGSSEGKKVSVSVNNKHYESYSLDEDGVYKIKTEKGVNILVIKGGKAYFKDSNCPDKTCEKMGKIEKAGESIVCLPHKVIAEVEE